MSEENKTNFWELKPKTGRKPLYNTPEELWEDCLEYFNETSKRVWNKVEYHGKDALKCHVPTSVPFTKEGLYIFLDINRQTWVNYREKADFLAICTRVESIIYAQKFEGAATGAYNANIIVRDLNLRETKDVNINERKNIQDLYPEELEGDLNGSENKPES